MQKYVCYPPSPELRLSTIITLLPSPAHDLYTTGCFLANTSKGPATAFSQKAVEENCTKIRPLLSSGCQYNYNTKYVLYRPEARESREGWTIRYMWCFDILSTIRLPEEPVNIESGVCFFLSFNLDLRFKTEQAYQCASFSISQNALLCVSFRNINSSMDPSPLKVHPSFAPLVEYTYSTEYDLQQRSLNQDKNSW